MGYYSFLRCFLVFHCSKSVNGFYEFLHFSWDFNDFLWVSVVSCGFICVLTGFFVYNIGCNRFSIFSNSFLSTFLGGYNDLLWSQVSGFLRVLIVFHVFLWSSKGFYEVSIDLGGFLVFAEFPWALVSTVF